MAGCRAGRTAAVRCGVAAAAAVAVVLAGCGRESEFEWPEDLANPSPAPLAPAELAATDEVLAAYEAFRQAEVAIQADPEPAHVAQDQLTEYLADPLLTLTLFEIETMHRRGLVRQGEPRSEPEVVELRLDDNPPTATVRDCLDASGWRLTDRATGTEADPTGLPARYALDRYLIELHASFVDGRWLFDEARVEGGEPC